MELAALKAQLAAQQAELTALKAVTSPTSSPPRPRTLTFECEDVPVEQASPDTPSARSILIEATPGSQVPAMVAAPLSSAERTSIQDEIKCVESALAALGPSSSLTSVRTELTEHLQSLRNRLHQSKSLADRKESLVLAIERKEAICTKASEAKAAAVAALDAATAFELESIQSKQALETELGQLEELIRAELAAEACPSEPSQDAQAVNLLHEIVAAQAAGRPTDALLASAASLIATAAPSSLAGDPSKI